MAKFSLYSLYASISTEGKVTVQFSNVIDKVGIDNTVLEYVFQYVQQFKHSALIPHRGTEREYDIYAIPIRRGSSPRIRETLLIIGHRHKIPEFAVKLNEVFIRLTDDKLMDLGRQEFLRELQNRIISVRALQGSSQESFESFCNWVVTQLSLLTNSHSVTVRKFCAYENTLDLVSAWEGEESQVRTQARLDCNQEESVSAFCFLAGHELGYVYIPDVNDIPDRYRVAGLTSVLRTRKQTTSEICLPIGHHPTRFGTLNLESTNFAAFELDVEFLQRVSFHTFQFWKALTTSGDAWWLSQLSLTHLATHELKDFKNSLNSRQRKELSNIIDTISPAEHFKNSAPVRWSDFTRFLVRAHNRISRKETFEKIWSIDGLEAEGRISPRFLGSLRLIIQSMLSNVRHSDYERNNISVKLRKINGNKSLEILYRSNVSFVDLIHWQRSSVASVRRLFQQTDGTSAYF